MMRDYKFRVRGQGFRRLPNRRSRRALRIGSLALAGGIGYAIVQALLSGDPSRPLPPEQEARRARGTEIIELELPQRRDPTTPPPDPIEQQAADSTPQAQPSPEENPDLASIAIPLKIAHSGTFPPGSLPTSPVVAALLGEINLFDPDQPTLATTPADLIGIYPTPGFPALELATTALPSLTLAFAPQALSGNGVPRQTPATPAAATRTASLRETLRQGPFRLDYHVQPGDTIGKILQEQGVPGGAVYRMIDGLEDAHRRRLARIRAGETIALHFDEALELHRVEFKLDAVDRLLLSREGERITAKIESAPIEQRRQCLTAVVENSVHGAAKSAGIPDQITQRALEIFSQHINFARQTRRGDQLSVLFEHPYVGDRPVRTGQVLAVEIIARGKQYAAVRYTTSEGKTDYYTPDGDPINRAKNTFLRAPLTYTRVSSGFSMNRMHPILGRSRPHTGVDFAAPAGRRVLAAADGRVHFLGRKSGYGNILIIRHGSKYETRYAHLMRFANGLSDGDRVKRGDTIGYVGQTGLATGPHLHYEIRINGRPVDPLTAKLPFLNEFDDKERARFRRVTRPLFAELQRNRERALLVDARSLDNTQDKSTVH